MLEVFNNLFRTSPSRWACGCRTRVLVKSRALDSSAPFSRRLRADRQRSAHAGEPGRMTSRSRPSSRKPADASGDVYVLNDPTTAAHPLPDVTVVNPSISRPTLPLALPPRGASRSGTRTGWAATSGRRSTSHRGHHDDIGGSTPGSTPAFSTRHRRIRRVVRHFLLFRDGVLREAELRRAVAPATGRRATPTRLGRPAGPDRCHPKISRMARDGRPVRPRPVAPNETVQDNPQSRCAASSPR